MWGLPFFSISLYTNTVSFYSSISQARKLNGNMGRNCAWKLSQMEYLRNLIGLFASQTDEDTLEVKIILYITV